MGTGGGGGGGEREVFGRGTWVLVVAGGSSKWTCVSFAFSLPFSFAAPLGWWESSTSIALSSVGPWGVLAPPRCATDGMRVYGGLSGLSQASLRLQGFLNAFGGGGVVMVRLAVLFVTSVFGEMVDLPDVGGVVVEEVPPSAEVGLDVVDFSGGLRLSLVGRWSRIGVFCASASE